MYLVRAALRYVTDTDRSKAAADWKAIDTSATMREAEQGLDEFAEACDNNDPTMVWQWQAKWTD